MTLHVCAGMRVELMIRRSTRAGIHKGHFLPRQGQGHVIFQWRAGSAWAQVVADSLRSGMGDPDLCARGVRSRPKADSSIAQPMATLIETFPLQSADAGSAKAFLLLAEAASRPCINAAGDGTASYQLSLSPIR